ncbi:hypothetical protein [Deinococcus sp. Leaf326]|uniref:hypothetical protein n=1 Tax=Deinococcus sp. Leaf326 TaxID=1736338 RepID=UPI0006F478BD|nr:hypothetical protein [Deinococcus sp. Leaf326]KQR25573.1 hypothetical protein ASF71_19005 [Deinococcus sp. Leaf326]
MTPWSTLLLLISQTEAHPLAPALAEHLRTSSTDIQALVQEAWQDARLAPDPLARRYVFVEGVHQLFAPLPASGPATHLGHGQALAHYATRLEHAPPCLHEAIRDITTFGQEISVTRRLQRDGVLACLERACFDLGRALRGQATVRRLEHHQVTLLELAYDRNETVTPLPVDTTQAGWAQQLAVR